MGFCRNCGSEVPEGTKFCANCGAAVELGEVKVEEAKKPEKNQLENLQSGVQQDAPVGNNVMSKTDKFGKFYGIALLVLAILDYYSDPAILTIILSLAIIAGCVFCFAKKYKLKIFTIVALILSIYCLSCGFKQANRIGLFTIPGHQKTVEKVSESPSDDVQNTDDVQASDSDGIKKDETNATKTIDGVDPELKEFLDGYEEFMDEYVDFMKKYMNDPGNALSMIGEYSKMMIKYEEFAEKADAYDTEEMSVADEKYYLEVLNRVNQKLLDIY